MRSRRRFLDALVTPPDTFGPSQTRVLRIAQRLRFGIAVAFVVVVPVLPGFSIRSKVVVSLAVIVYVAASWYVEERAAAASWMSARVVNPLIGIVATLVVGVAAPEAFAGTLFIYTLGLVFYTLIGGLGLGLWIAAGAVPSALLTNYVFIAAEYRVDALTLTFFGLTMFACAFLCDLVTRERRVAAAGLDRLHEALRSVSASPNLSETLESVVGVIDESMGAVATGVLLREDDHLVLASPAPAGEWPEEWTINSIREYTRRELMFGDASPIGASVTCNELVSVPDVSFDNRFPHWCDQWREIFKRSQINSLVIVPLRLGPDVIGVLAACFEVLGGLEDDDLELLDAYADQVAIVIARAQAYEQQHEAARRLAEADRVKSEFLAMVSHELRTPLTAAKGFVDTVLLHWHRLPDERRRQLLERASGNADELSRLVIQLLDFSRMDADRVEVRPQRCNLRELVEGVVSQSGPVVANHEVDMVVPVGLQVSVDPDAFGQVLLNLLTNAVKFSPAGSSIRVHARSAGDEAVVSVRDEGVGISPADQERIFERFYQARNSDASRRGTGIGLAIVRRFVEMHGGRIWVDSSPGTGSTFTFTLPLASGETSPADVSELRRTEPEPVSSGSEDAAEEANAAAS